MARIPEAELERLKAEVSLARLIAPKPEGARHQPRGLDGTTTGWPAPRQRARPMAPGVALQKQELRPGMEPSKNLMAPKNRCADKGLGANGAIALS
jgi:hypothetical protein